MSIDDSELIAGTRVPAVSLEGEREQAYLDAMQRIMRGARLNTYYPDARAVGAHLHAMHPARHRGIYPGVDIDARTGLPTYKEWTRVQTDVALASDQLHQLGDRRELARKAEQRPDSVFARQLAKHDYYSAIEGIPTATLGDMTVKLRRIERDTSTAHFNVILDKLDSSGLFLRYSIDLSQQGAQWRGAVRVEDGDIARQSEAFQALIYQFTSLDSEMTFARIRTMDGMNVERVIKGIIGPIFFDLDGVGTHTPEPLAAFVAEHGWLATFSLDQTAYDIEESRENDPFVDILSASTLDAATREKFASARANMGYKVFKDRKFVVPRSAVGAARELCAEHGTKNIVYGF
jgi:hypothetical protein